MLRQLLGLPPKLSDEELEVLAEARLGCLTRDRWSDWCPIYDHPPQIYERLHQLKLIYFEPELDSDGKPLFTSGFAAVPCGTYRPSPYVTGEIWAGVDRLLASRMRDGERVTTRQLRAEERAGRRRAMGVSAEYRANVQRAIADPASRWSEDAEGAHAVLDEVLSRFSVEEVQAAARARNIAYPVSSRWRIWDLNAHCKWALARRLHRHADR